MLVKAATGKCNISAPSNNHLHTYFTKCGINGYTFARQNNWFSKAIKWWLDAELHQTDGPSQIFTLHYALLQKENIFRKKRWPPQNSWQCPLPLLHVAKVLTPCSVVLRCVLALTGKIYISILSWFKTLYMEILNYVKQKQIWYTRGWLDSFKYNSCVCEFAASHLQIYLLIHGMHIVTFWWTYVSSFFRWFFFINTHITRKRNSFSMRVPCC